MSPDQRRPVPETRDLTAVSVLLAAMPDPDAVNEHWRRICREMVTETAASEYERGLAEGYMLAVADFKAFQHGAVRDADLEVKRWGPGGRGRFGEARPGDYPGRKAA